MAGRMNIRKSYFGSIDITLDGIDPEVLSLLKKTHYFDATMVKGFNNKDILNLIGKKKPCEEKIDIDKEKIEIRVAISTINYSMFVLSLLILTLSFLFYHSIINVFLGGNLLQILMVIFRILAVLFVIYLSLIILDLHYYKKYLKVKDVIRRDDFYKDMFEIFIFGTHFFNW